MVTILTQPRLSPYSLPMRLPLLSFLSLVTMVTLQAHPAHDESRPPTAAAMSEAARNFLDSLDEKQRTAATGDLTHEARTQWTYLPGDRKGIMLEAMSEAQRQKAHALLQSALSDRGLWQATTIMQLEQVLRDLGGGAHRDPDLYAVAVYGEPKSGHPWAWRIEGHHLSLHFTVAEDGAISDSPAFLGANPARVPSGDLKGTRALGKEEDRGRELMLDLDEKQQQQARIGDKAPRDIVTRSKSRIEREAPQGIAFSELNSEQQEALQSIIRLYIDRFAPDLAEADWQLVTAHDFQDIHFAWAGSLEPDQRHYYRIQGEAFLIEFDKVQKNHVHSVLRFFGRDFGRDFLKEHHEAHTHEE